MMRSRPDEAPEPAHTSPPWRIHEFTRDFGLEHAWEPAGTDDAGDFPRLIEGLAAAPGTVRFLA